MVRLYFVLLLASFSLLLMGQSARERAVSTR